MYNDILNFRQRTHIAAGKHLRKCDCSSRSEIGLSEGHIHYYINDDSNKDVITVGYSSANAVPINFGMNCGREHKREHTLFLVGLQKVGKEYMGAEHEQIATAVDSTINVKTNGDIMTLIVGAAITNKVRNEFIEDTSIQRSLSIVFERKSELRLEGLAHKVHQWYLCRMEGWFAADSDTISLNGWDRVGRCFLQTCGILFKDSEKSTYILFQNISNHV
ncbi:unnamed protein product [Vicia faba]|uniref:VAN3-binding protein-like auxin canalisation domain-containing protein n=1 Tax=Vicia faba TaxID=3906 RepID=A0AAV0ZBV1_VICFA|nr:unnamed protein product [Vicia faba]